MGDRAEETNRIADVRVKHCGETSSSRCVGEKVSYPRGRIVGVEEVLEQFGPATREWFRAAFAAPTAAQAGAWRAVGAGRNALVVAPTGSGKTLAAFLWSLDRLAHEPMPEDAK